LYERKQETVQEILDRTQRKAEVGVRRTMRGLQCMPRGGSPLEWRPEWELNRRPSKTSANRPRCLNWKLAYADKRPKKKGVSDQKNCNMKSSDKIIYKDYGEKRFVKQGAKSRKTGGGGGGRRAGTPKTSRKTEEKR